MFIWSILMDIWNLFVRLFRSEREPGGNDDDDFPFIYVLHYGCPNSKKAEKLQLGRKAVR